MKTWNKLTVGAAMTAILAAGLNPAAAQTSNWNGSSNSNWSKAANWDTLPVEGSDLVFGSVTATNTTAKNNSAGPFPLVNVNSITFVDGPGTQAFTVNGQPINLGINVPNDNNNITLVNNSTSLQTVSFGGTGITLVAPHANTAERWDAKSGDLNVTSDVALNGTTLIGMSSGGTAHVTTLSGKISGVGSNGQNASLIVGDNGVTANVVLTGNNNTLGATSPFGASVELRGGTLTIGHKNALGTGLLLIDNTFTSSAATLATDANDYTIDNGIRARTDFTVSTTNALKIKGDVRLDIAHQTTFNITNNSSGSVNFNGAISDGGDNAGVTLNGTGTTTYSGNTSNTYTGLTRVTGGQTLNLDKQGIAVAVAGALQVDHNSTVNFLGNNQTATTTDVQLNTNAVLNLNGKNQTIATLNDDNFGTSQVNLGAGKLTVGAGSYNGTISDDGAQAGNPVLVKTGPGELDLRSNNNLTGNVKLEGGVLGVGATDSLGSGNLNVTATSTLTNTDHVPVPVLSIGNDIKLNGQLTVAGGNLLLKRAFELDGKISGASPLVIGRGPDLAPLPGPVPQGVVILNNDNNNFTGGTTIDNGAILLVGKEHALGDGDVVNHGTLATVANTNGIPIAGSNADGETRTIRIGGDFTQGADGTYLSVAYDGNPAHQDLLSVQGTATVGGKLIFLDGDPVAVGKTYTLITSDTAPVIGTFSSVMINPLGVINPFGPLYVPIVGYNIFGNNVVVQAALNLNLFLNGLTPNQRSVAKYINKNINITSSDFFSNVRPKLDNAALNGKLGSSLDMLSPQQLQVLRHIAFDNFGFAAQSLDDHLASLRYGNSGFDGSGFQVLNGSDSPMMSQIRGRLLAWDPNAVGQGLTSDIGDPILAGVRMSDPKDMKMTCACPITDENRWSAFINGNVILADISSDSDVAHTNYTTGGITAGADYRVDRNWTVGGLFNYSHTGTDVENDGSHVRVDSYSPGVYAAYNDGGWYANGLLAYNYNDYDEARDIAFLGRTASGSPTGSQFDANFDGGYEFHCGAWTFGPTAALQFVHLEVEDFTETGAGSANLYVKSQQDDSLRSRVGFQVRYQAKWGRTMITPHLSGSWQHEYLDNSRGLTASLTGLGGGSFLIEGAETDRDSALLDFGVDAQVTRSLSLFVDYMAQAGQDDFFAQSIQAGLKVGF